MDTSEKAVVEALKAEGITQQESCPCCGEILDPKWWVCPHCGCC